MRNQEEQGGYLREHKINREDNGEDMKENEKSGKTMGRNWE